VSGPAFFGGGNIDPAVQRTRDEIARALKL